MVSEAHGEGQDARRGYLTSAPHVGQAYATLIARCRHAVRTTPGLDYVSHYGSGVFDFSVDAFDSGEYAGLLSAPVEVVREDHQHAARQLISRVEDLDASLGALDSGELMRTVVETGSGAFHCGRIRAGEYLVGATLDPSGTSAMDWGMNDLVTGIRVGDLHIADRRPGGIHVAELPELVASTDPRTEPGPALGMLSQPKLFDLWAHAVNPQDLHYAALYRDWSLVHAGDVLGDPDLSAWFRNVTVEVRRRLYRDVAGRLRTDVARLRQTLRRVGDTPIVRLVLDVEEGAIYVQWLGSGIGDFVLGVTLMQDMVDQAELRLRRLVERLGAVIG